MAAASSSLRDTHRAVFDRLRAGGAASRAALAKAVGLSPPAVGQIVDDLLAARLVEEDDAAPGSIGRPAKPVRLNRRERSVLAVQIGVRHVRLAALPVAGPDDESWPIRFATPRGAAALQRQLAAALGPLKTAARRPAAVALSVPGVVDEAAGRVLKSPNLPWIEALPLRDFFAGVTRAPLVCVQEIRALALGQLQHDAAHDSFFLVDVGEGVGGAVVWRGKLYDPPLPVSGELGHSPVPGNHRRCGCGATGCLETLVARRGLLKSFAAQANGRGAAAARVRWSELTAHVHAHGVEPWLAPTLSAAGRGIGAALNLLGVSRVVLTGALSELGPAVLDEVAAAIRQAALWGRFGTIDVVAAPRRRAAGLVVAAVDRVLLASPPRQ